MQTSQQGHFVAVEGADGVGKSTVIGRLLPKLMETFGYTGILFFHWKPVTGNLHDGGIPETVPHDPRGSRPRNPLASLAYLGYHWLSFLCGYRKNVVPALRAGKLVLADRYTYDIFLDPRRFRLNVPRWILRVFVKTLPQPDAVLALVATPETIVARKHELTIEEIRDYQEGLKSSIIPRIVIVDADATLDVVVQDALDQLSDALALRAR